MRRILFLAPLVLALLTFGPYSGPSKSYAAVYVDDLYYDQLDPYGDWYFVASYGWVWSPGYVSAGWRPYTVGYWVCSDYGWLWVAQDPWGSWPYHYGRWSNNASYGWIWIPGDIWAPAWVSWRYGSGWVGWAPLPPDVEWSFGIGIRYSSISVDQRIVSSGWCFVPVNDFANRRVRGRVVSVNRNVTLIERTRNVTKYVDVGSRPVERGLRVEQIERDVGKRIPRYDVTERSVQGRGGVEVRGRTVTVSKPTRSVVRAANSKLRALPKDRAEAPGRAVRENVNASRRQLNERSERQRREREAERLRQGQDRRSQQTDVRRSRQGQDRRSQQEQVQRSKQAQERRSKQAQERRRKQEQEERDRGQGRGKGDGGT